MCRHSLIVAVNTGLVSQHDKLPSSATTSSSLPPCQLSILGPEGAGAAASSRTLRTGSCGETLQIDINVIQPTPNISPTHSLRSISGKIPQFSQ